MKQYAHYIGVSDSGVTYDLGFVSYFCTRLSPEVLMIRIKQLIFAYLSNMY